MPLFPRFVSHNPSVSYKDIHPLIQAVLQDPSYYNQSPTHASSRSSQASPQPASTGTRKTFSPAFDVRETEKAYILEGELPGLSNKKAVDIEFTDHQTLLVKGRVEKVADYPNETPKGQTQITLGEEAPKRPHTPPKPTVEDDIDEDDVPSSIKMTPTSSTNTTATKVDNSKKQQPQQPQVRHWISERSVGAFQRSFSFPGLIDQEAVTASLQNGILTIVVPKKTTHVTKKIEIQ